jgi:Sulfotransferase family
MQSRNVPVVQPIFILSLPRTGSTLLQRILGSHEAVATASEPGFLLPLVYSLRRTGIDAEYGHRVIADGVRGFAEEYLPGGLASYLDAVRDFALHLYAEAAGGKPYFLDKTPGYQYIGDELIHLFPTGRFIFLWRHPLAIAASMMEMFDRGKWNLDSFAADLFRGLPALLATHRIHEGRVASVTYEELVTEPAQVIDRLLDSLGLPADPSLVKRFPELKMRNARFWDPTGTARYNTVSTEPLTKWHATMANPVRKLWCRRYVRWLGADHLAQMGYDRDEILAEIASVRPGVHGVASDLYRAGAGAARRWIRGRVIDASLPLWSPR